MKISAFLKNTYRKVVHSFEEFFGSNRLSPQPRFFYPDAPFRRKLSELRKLFLFTRKTNIAIVGGEAVGKKSLIITYEKRRVLCIGRFINIDLRAFAGNHHEKTENQSFDSAFLSSLSTNILAHHPERETKKVLLKAILSFLCIFVILTADKWKGYLNDFLPTSWNLSLICFILIAICVCVLISNLYYIVLHIRYALPSARVDKISANPTSASVDVSFGAEPTKQKLLQQISNTVYQMRWLIGHTVYFTGLEELGDDVQQSVYLLKEVNSAINSTIKNRVNKLVSHLYRPVRFIYIYRNDLVQIRNDERVFDSTIRISPSIGVENAFNKLEKAFASEVKRNPYVSIEGLFPLDDAKYQMELAPHICNRRTINLIVKEYVEKYTLFNERLGKETPSSSDIRRLFSFSIYSSFFPSDSYLFARRKSAVFTGKPGDEITESEHSDLFYYLTSTDCSEEYRINYLCCRYSGGFDPGLRDQHLNYYRNAIREKKYPTARYYLENAICCNPTKKLLRKREELLKKIDNGQQRD